MRLKFVGQPDKNAILIIPILSKRETTDSALNKLLEQLADKKEFEGNKGQTFFYPEKLAKSWPERLFLIGLGKEENLNTESVLLAFGNVVKELSKHRPKKIALFAIEPLLPFARAIAEAIVLANYHPSAIYKTGKLLKKITDQTIEEIEFIGIKTPEIKKDFELGLETACVVNEVRDWVNAPPNYADIKFFAAKAREIGKATGAKVEILNKKQLERLGMEAFLAVNRGSDEEAKLIIIDYSPKGTDKKMPPIALVGKGIPFDSGGYNLKPRGHIEDMQLDKAGACALLGLAKLLPKLNIKKRVVILTPFTQNLIGPNAFKPSEIIKTYLGKTVEITNTDGEGRLILCDALAYANKIYKPACLIDIATLTGACMVALGDKYAGLFGNNKILIKQLRKAGNMTDELLWPMPIHKSHAAKMKGYYADLRNAESAGGAGASKGAAFLKEFVGKTPWAHLDIAGPSFTKDPKKYESKGATGFGVRLLLRFLENLR